MMDKRALARLFAERLRRLAERQPGGLAALSRTAGIDRSALGAFLAPDATRLPRVEALRRLAEAGEVSADWLLGLSHAEERGPRALTPAAQIEAAVTPDGESPIARWHREAAGHKIRYVPSALPDLMCLPEVFAHGDGAASTGRATTGEATLAAVEAGVTDMEIALAVQAVDDLAAGSGLWRDLSPGLRRRQLARMAELTAAHYPALRLHLYDGAGTYAAPFTVFGPTRAALYLGAGYLVLTAAEDVRRMARLFDDLVRRAVVPSDAASARLAVAARRGG
ncbi:MAG: helix-turn-helix domain-containing protein [Paracoccaceae bacterium]